MAGTNLGDANTTPAITDAHADASHALSSEAFKSSNSYDTISGVATTQWGRVEQAGLEALNPSKLAQGVGNAIVNDYENPMQVVKMVGTSALLGAAFKTVLPEDGPVGLIAGVGLGAYFMYQSFKPMGQAVGEAINAKTSGDIHQSARDMDNVAGSLAVNSALSMGAYKLGAGATDYVLKSQHLDSFAEAKNNLWNGFNDQISGFMKSVKDDGSAEISLGLQTPASVGTERVALAGSDSPTPGDSTVVGDAPPNAEMNVSLYLTPNQFQLSRALTQVQEGRANYSDISNADFARKFGPSEKSFQDVENFATQYGLSVKNVNPAAGCVQLSGTTCEMDKAFGTKIQDFQGDDSSDFHAQIGTITLPKDLSGEVEAVLGLDNREVAHTNVVTSENQPELGAHGVVFGSNRKFMPQDVAKAYNFPMGKGGAGSGIGIVELGGGLDLQDNAVYYKENGLLQPNIKVIEIDGAKNAPTDASGDDREVVLDSQVVGAVAPKATQNIVFAPNNKQGFVDAVTRLTFPTNGEASNQAISISWGSPESKWTPQAATAMRTAIQEAAVKGINVFAAAGDAGAQDGATDFQADLPASVPEAIGVGGTNLLVRPGGKLLESAWNQGDSSATGGGISEKFPVPDFQKGVDLPANANGGGTGPGRGVPDIAGDADPRTGYKIRVDGTETSEGGTSAAAPLYAALTALLTTENGGKSFGWLTPTLYKLGASGQGAVFNDVVEGNNNGYKSGQGWDATTGWGSINGTDLLKALQQNAQASSLRTANTANLSRMP